jgi:hypothetical protein
MKISFPSRELSMAVILELAVLLLQMEISKYSLCVFKIVPGSGYRMLISGSSDV